MYDHGDGVLQDDAEAVLWYRLAAEQGHLKAQLNLGILYYLGEGIAQDYLRAHIWMELAAMSGMKSAQKSRDHSAENMTSQQIAKAQEMVKECLASKYKDCD